MDRPMRDAATAALVELHQSGSPVVRQDNVDEILAIATRRWRSLERRDAKHVGHLEARIEDVAKGLRDHFEEEPSLVGPLMEDYRFVAGVLAREFSRS